MRLKSDAMPGESTANLLTGPLDTPIQHPVELVDNTLREGEQPPEIVFTPEEKLEIARALDELGVHWASAGFPAVSAEERASVSRICRAGLRMKVGAMSRLLPSDIDLTADCGVQLLGLFVGGSDTHLRKLGLSEAEAFSRIEAGVRRAADHGVAVAFGVEDATRTPLPRLLRMFQIAAEAGASQLIVADTVGILTPPSTTRLVGILTALLPVPLALHFHDDLGLALANTLAGIHAGARITHSTVNGFGERAGNVCTAELAVLLQWKYGLDLGLRLDRLMALSQLVHRVSGTQPGLHKAITGRWCFTHESGIHVAGILSDPECYQPFPPELVGRHHEIVFGKHSGAQGISWLAAQEGLPLSDAGRSAVLDKVKRQAERLKRTVPDEQVLAWIREESGVGVG